MKKEYKRYFNRYYNITPRNINQMRIFPYAQKYLHDIVDRIINDDAHWISWRDDARHFIVINMYHFVIHPIYMVEDHDHINTVFEKHQKQITNDIRRLIVSSSEVAGGRRLDYVSGTSVAIALGSMVEDLDTASMQIWGPEEDEDNAWQ